MKSLGPCEVRWCGKAATWSTDDDERFCDDHTRDWLMDDKPGDDWADTDGLNDDDFAEAS